MRGSRMLGPRAWSACSLHLCDFTDDARMRFVALRGAHRNLKLHYRAAPSGGHSIRASESPSSPPRKPFLRPSTCPRRRRPKESTIHGPAPIQRIVDGPWFAAASLLVLADVIGPQAGQGKLAGQFHQSGVLSLDFHPGTADDNILLTGVFDPAGQVFEGTWSHSTFVGTRVEDRFRTFRR